MTTPQEVLDFWFGPSASLPERGSSGKEWFRRDSAFDNEIRRRFGSEVERAIAGDFAFWERSSDGALALILLLDQFPRNLYRDDGRAFAGDARARSVAEQVLHLGYDKQRTLFERLFFYLPFEHSEKLADQDRAVELIAELGDAELTDYAVRHRNVIRRFGRFPHRNKALGRTSTLQEEEFLKLPDSSF